MTVGRAARAGRGGRRGPAERRRRVLRSLSTVLVVTGLLTLVDGVLTLVWQEPLTAFTSARAQAGLQDELGRLRRDGPTTAQTATLLRIAGEPQRLAFLARELRQKAREGAAIARLRIPALDLDRVVVQGTGASSLHDGPGIYDTSPFPGVPGTTAIAGHRTTYGAPFRDIDRLDPGDRVIVEMPYGTFTYAVTGTRIVAPSDVSVLAPADVDRLVLTACHPLFSAKQRIVVTARLQRAVGTGVARRDSMGPPLLSDRVQRPSR